MRMRVQSLALLSGWKIQHCCKRQLRLQRQHGSGFAASVVSASSYSSDSIPNRGTSIHHRHGPKKKKKKWQASHIFCLSLAIPAACGHSQTRDESPSHSFDPCCRRGNTRSFNPRCQTGGQTCVLALQPCHRSRYTTVGAPSYASVTGTAQNDAVFFSPGPTK